MYYLYLEQKGEGCDYTISCGEKLISLDGDTLEEATKDAEQYFDGENYGYGRGEYKLSRALILKFEMDAMPMLDRMLMVEKLEREAAEKRKKESLERDELERLKKKYGG